MFLVEGPLPGGTGVGTNLGNNIARDDGAFKALVVMHPTASTSTSDPAIGAAVEPGIATFPGGIWTVERVFVGFKTAGGVDNARFSIGYEKVRISKDEWLALVASSPNSRVAGQLIG